MEAALAPAPPAKGRPREFCTDRALAAALRVFWTKGFDGASLTDLTDAMGITRPSLYAAFGNKEALFRKALDLYEREKMAYVSQALEAPTARGVAERLLRGALAIQASTCDPKGCMGVMAAVACGEATESIRTEVVARRASAQAALVERFERARAEGDFGAEIAPEGLARLLTTIKQGMAVQASAGASVDELERLIEMSLQVWPGR